MAPARSYLAPAALCAAALLPAASANFGNSFYLGPWDGDAYITKATYSLTAPAVIQDCQYRLFLLPQSSPSIFVCFGMFQKV